MDNPLDLALRDYIRIVVAAFTLLILLIAASWLDLGVFGLGLILVGAASLLILVQVQYSRRILNSLEAARAHRRDIRQQQWHDFEQLEALTGIYVALTTTVEPLPPTRDWAASPDFLRLTYNTIRQKQPETILELGSGSSTIVAGYALRQNGSGWIVSLDHLRKYAELTSKMVDSHGLENCCTVLEAPLLSHRIGTADWQWYDLGELHLNKAIDMVIVDGPPGGIQELSRYPALPLLVGRLADDATILVDDGNRQDEKRIVERWSKEYPEFVAEYHRSEKGAYVLQRYLAPRATDAETRHGHRE